MLVIRLQRTGRENTPTYRIVLSEKAPHAQKAAPEVLGHYLPSRKEPVFECNQQRVAHWVKQGAEPSDTLARLLKRAGMTGLEQFIKRYTKQKSKGEEPQAAVQPPPAAQPEAAGQPAPAGA